MRYAPALGVVLASLVLAACAVRTGLAGPVAFPTAPVPPAAARPDTPVAAPSDLVQTALGFRGIPYHLGGDSPARGFDCSGFVQYVFNVNRIALPRTVLEQAGLGHRINAQQLRPGDLLFFATGAHGVSHVGIAIGQGEFVHAPADQGVVRIDRVASPYWQRHFREARRLLSAS
jgi:cell wall-associated NlpC family hydrolase